MAKTHGGVWNGIIKCDFYQAWRDWRCGSLHGDIFYDVRFSLVSGKVKYGFIRFGGTGGVARQHLLWCTLSGCMLLAGQRQSEGRLYQVWRNWRRGTAASCMMYPVRLHASRWSAHVTRHLVPHFNHTLSANCRVSQSPCRPIAVSANCHVSQSPCWPNVRKAYVRCQELGFFCVKWSNLTKLFEWNDLKRILIILK